MDCKMERKEYCCYLNGVAEGLSKAKEDTLSELEKVREDIRVIMSDIINNSCDFTIGLAKSIEIIDEHICGLREGAK